MKKYLRSIVEEFPHAAAESYHVFGWRGAYLAFSALVLRRQPFAVSLAGYGRLESRAEAVNLIDNFALGELRSDAAEKYLRELPEAWVVDVGVNIGLTCRWWLALAPTARVVGIDMFQEALDHTTERIAAEGQVRRWHPICAAVGDKEGSVEVRFDDPLEGTSRLDSSSGGKSRRLRIQTLDSLLTSVVPGRIALLKLDIEGSAGRALLGASSTLRRCDYVVVETHSDEETETASRALTAAGLQLYRSRGRTIWWRRSVPSAT